MRLGMVGLGRMGSNMAARLREHGHEVVGYDASGTGEVDSLADLVDRAGEAGSRVVWVMVPAGDPTEEVVTALGGLLASGDLVIEGGNSFWRDSVRRAGWLADRGIGFIDCGVSGGIWGRTNGYGLMYGGEPGHVERARPLFEALAPPEGGHAHVGPVGAGHFTKMVHNGIEYGLMQAYAEGYELLTSADLDIDVDAAMAAWRHGTVIRSWLLDLIVRALEAHPGLSDVAPWVEDSGEGRWTVTEAVRLAVPVPAISAALAARFASRGGGGTAARLVAALREQFGGHAIRTTGTSPEARP